MKIKCNDYLPDHDGSFMTDVGLLDFHTSPYCWHSKNSWTIQNMVVDAHPKWWFNPNPIDR